MLVGGQQHARRQLLALGEITLQRLTEVGAFERHDALVTLAAAVGLEGDRQQAPATQLDETGFRCAVLAAAGNAAQVAGAVALGVEQPQPAGTLQLDRQAAVELQPGHQQCARRQGLSQQAGDAGRVGLALDDLSMASHDAHGGATDSEAG